MLRAVGAKKQGERDLIMVVYGLLRMLHVQESDVVVARENPFACFRVRLCCKVLGKDLQCFIS